MVDEPVRGSLPDPSFYSLPGLEQWRAWQQGLTPAGPLHHLTGFRLTQVDAGVVTTTLPYLQWFQFGDGTVDISVLVELACMGAVTTVTPGGSEPQVTSLSVQYLRPPTLKGESFLARGRVLNVGPKFAVVEAVVEDAFGREAMRALASAVIRPLDPPPPHLVTPLERVQQPIYATPNPYRRPAPRGAVLSPHAIDELDGWEGLFAGWASGQLSHPAICDLFGLRCRQAREGTASWTMRASRWLCGDRPHIQGGLLALARCALTSASASRCGPRQVAVVMSDSLSLMRPILPDGTEIGAEATSAVTGDIAVSHVRIFDDSGALVAAGSQTALIAARSAPRTSEPERLLLTVLFTDVVGSTEQAGRLGDARWHELLDQHHGVVRRQLEAFKGHEVKTTGDGFLATFDSPGLAVQAARAIGDGVRPLGLEVRIGLHTGECEVSGADVAGIAVHIASRIQALAGPGEVLVSGTVRDLVTGSGLRFADRGRHELKGIEGDWPVYALEG